MSLLLKKKRVSKKSKQSWRKHVDTKDVDEFLDDKRLQERLGKEYSLRTNDELFRIDQKPTDVKLTSKQSKRLALKNAPLKCFSMLESHSKVPDPITKRNHVRPSLGLKNPRKAKNNVLSRKKALKVAKRNNETENVDIWSDGTSSPQKMPEWLSTNCIKHNLRNTGKSIKTVPKSVRSKQTLISAIEPPHPGISYNPSRDDHRDLLRVIVEKEHSLIKQEVHLNRVTSKMFTKLPAAERESEMLTEMSEGLNKLNDPTNSENSDFEDREDIMSAAVKNRKKTLKQKRKIREQRALKVSRKNAHKEKKKIADIYKLKQLSAKLSAKEEKELKVQELRKEKKAQKVKETKVLSKIKFEDPELEFNMKKDIAGNLRNVKKEGSLLLDRFKSLQKRNVIEPTISQGLRKRTKVKRFTKKSHQDK